MPEEAIFLGQGAQAGPELRPADRSSYSWRDRLREAMILKYGEDGKRIAENLIGKSEEEKFQNYLLRTQPPPPVRESAEDRTRRQTAFDEGQTPTTRSFGDIFTHGPPDIGMVDLGLMGLSGGRLPYVSTGAALTESSLLAGDALGEYKKGRPKTAAVMGALSAVNPLLRYFNPVVREAAPEMRSALKHVSDDAPTDPAKRETLKKGAAAGILGLAMAGPPLVRRALQQVADSPVVAKVGKAVKGRHLQLSRFRSLTDPVTPRSYNMDGREYIQSVFSYASRIPDMVGRRLVSLDSWKPIRTALGDSGPVQADEFGDYAEMVGNVMEDLAQAAPKSAAELSDLIQARSLSHYRELGFEGADDMLPALKKWFASDDYQQAILEGAELGKAYARRFPVDANISARGPRVPRFEAERNPYDSPAGLHSRWPLDEGGSDFGYEIPPAHLRVFLEDADRVAPSLKPHITGKPNIESSWFMGPRTQRRISTDSGDRWPTDLGRLSQADFEAFKKLSPEQYEDVMRVLKDYNNP